MRLRNPAKAPESSVPLDHLSVLELPFDLFVVTMLSLASHSLLRAPLKLATSASKVAPIRSARPRPLSPFHLNSSKFVQSRYYRLSSKVFDNAFSSKSTSQDDLEDVDEKVVDFSILHPKGKPVDRELKLSQSAKTYTDAQKERSTKALKKLASRIPTLREPNSGDNQRFVDSCLAGNDSEVIRLWTDSLVEAFIVSPGAYCAALVSISRMENEGVSVSVTKMLQDIQASKRPPVPLFYIILMEHSAKIGEFARAKRDFHNFAYMANHKYEDLEERHEGITESGYKLPEDLSRPNYGVAQDCGYDSMEDVVNALEYYSLLISASDGTAGPLSRLRTIDALVSKWNCTLLGKRNPMRTPQIILDNEEEISKRFLSLD